MNARERGFLLLSSHLGNPDRKPLTVPQLRTLADRMRLMGKPVEDRDLQLQDLIALGYGSEFAQRVLCLLDEEDLLEHYLYKGKTSGCVPVTRVTDGYPLILRKRLGLDCPGSLWCKGDIHLLDTPAVALVGSRDLQQPNREFAEEVGRQAALQGLTLVSGNARGADRTAQESCLRAGGQVISVVADELSKQPLRENVLYVSEEDFEAEFSAQRAISRNRVIHALGRMVFVAQSHQGKGGTWDGTVKNLRFGWSPVLCFRDGSEAACQLEQMGAFLIDTAAVLDFGALQESDALQESEMNFFDR